MSERLITDCAKCKDEDARFSLFLGYYVCDSCFTEIMDEKEDKKAWVKTNG